jgi:hypothetical protein
MGFFGGGGSAGIGGSTGATDNAILRADGTGAATLQNSDLNVDDATTTTQNNVAITNQHSGQTNSGLVITPKGTGAFIVGPKPDGTSTGGNARGTRAICMVTNRSGATQVASGNESVAIGNQAIASNLQAIAIGGANASGAYAVAIGLGAIASNAASCAIGGQDNNATAARSFVIGYGGRGDRQTTFAHGIQPFAANGDAQTIRAVLRAKTTTNSAVEFFIDGSSVRLTVPSGKIMAMLINITGAKSDGSAVAHYLRQYCIKNVAGTTSEVYAPVTIGTDNAAGTSITISANDTNDALKIEATGVSSETWRWVASVDAVEVAYGT